MGFLGGIGADFFGSLVGGINDALSFVWDILKDIFGGIKKFLSHLWECVIKKIPGEIINAVTRLRGILTTIFNIASQIIEQMRTILDYVYKHFIRPYLIMIQRVRQVLQLFRLLGFKWAKRLDARLAALEQKIVSIFLTIRAPLNQIISFVGLIADPLAILRRNPVIGALLRNAPEIKNAIDRATNHPTTQHEIDSANTDNGWYQPSQRPLLTAYFKGGPTPQFILDARAEFASANAELPALAKQELD
jgi:hypothetical protein